MLLPFVSSRENAYEYTGTLDDKISINREGDIIIRHPSKQTTRNSLGYRE